MTELFGVAVALTLLGQLSPGGADVVVHGEVDFVMEVSAPRNDPPLRSSSA